MKKLLVLFLLPLYAVSQNVGKYPTLLWKISGNGLKKPSYLYGTMHVSNKVAYYLSEQFFDALKGVDVVGLETNPGDWLDNMEKTGELMQLSRFRSSGNGNNFYHNAFNLKFPDKKMLQGILSFDPDIIDGLLYRQNRSRENFEESTYIDLFIYQSAAKLNKQLISLEDFSQSEIKARLSALPDESGEERGEKNYSNYYSLPQKIENAYREGNLDVLDSLSKLNSSANTRRFLINDRNVFFVNTIDSVLKTKTLFSGVGAAHLPGPDGVIELLRKKGYTVEPVRPKVSNKSNKMREELDLQIKPVTFQKQSATDSLFTVQVPGKLYPILNIENLKYFINADMANGAFYTIVRLRHQGTLSGISTPQLMARVDSLLFEGIPGKIISRKEITAPGGIKGFDIVNKTRRSDQQHYQIFFTDAEMIMFKLGGKRDYATGSESRQFFNSIQFSQKTGSMVDFSPRSGGFRVRLPYPYFYEKNESGVATGLVEDLYSCSVGGRQSYGVKHSVYNDFFYLEEDTFELNRLARNTLINFNFTVSPSYQIKKHQGFPAIQFTGVNPAGSFFSGKICIKGVHYYLAYTTAQNQIPFTDDFFNNFKLTDFEYVNPLKKITDKELHFRVIDEVSDNSLSRFNEAYAKAYDASRVKKDTVKNDFDYQTNSKYYYSPSSNEYVNITYEKYNNYDYRDVKDLHKKIEENFRNTSSMLITASRHSYENGLYRYSCIFRDTATQRAIDLRLFIRNGIMHELCAPYDTTIGLKGWAKSFMDSFEPIDTVIAKDIFKNKFSTLLDDLCGQDTLKRQQANTSLRTAVGMHKAFADDFIKFIGSDRFDKVNEESRAQLLVNGGSIENENIIEPYKKLYKHYTDSFYLQLCILKGLGNLKTAKSFDAFYSLLMQETPLVGADNTVKDVFSSLHDSLELCRKFFPGMLALSRYDEYRDAVYCLMADLVNQKLLSPATYSLQKENILVDANLALKRYTPSTGKSAQNEDYGNFDYLDKNVKELAENIKLNLDAFINNNLYKGSRYLRSIDFYNRPALVNYAYVLAPFYSADEKTRQYFTRLAKLKAQNIIMPVTINLLKQNITLSDTMVPYFCRNKYTRTFFYSELEKEKLTRFFDKTYLNQGSLNESLVSSQKQLNTYYNYDKEKNKKDSISLLKVLAATNKFQKGRLYVYRLQKGKNDDEQWSAVFVPESSEPVNSHIEMVSQGYFIDKTKTEQENLNELLDYFYLSFRKRAGNQNPNYD